MSHFKVAPFSSRFFAFTIIFVSAFGMSSSQSAAMSVRGDSKCILPRKSNPHLATMNSCFESPESSVVKWSGHCVPNFDLRANRRGPGFRCFNIESQEVLKDAGLVNGDIVTRIDGERLGTSAQAEKLLFEVRTEPDANVHVLRDGREQILHINPL